MIALLVQIRLLRESLDWLLGRAGLPVALSTDDADEFLGHLPLIRPTRAVVGPFPTWANALGLLRAARQIHPEGRVVLLADAPDDLFRQSALDAGAQSVLDPRRVRLHELLALLGPLTQAAGAAPADGKLLRLTPREAEVLRCVVAGMDNLKIGAWLGIGERTVKAHMHAIYAKVESETRTELAIYALQQGVRPPDDYFQISAKPVGC